MKGLRPLSESVPHVTGKLFSRKYIMLGRLVTHWSDIIGAELAEKTQPVKIRYYKSKTKKDKPTASLDIASSTADATVLHYQKDLILERINHIFGEKWITAIRFVPQAANKSTPSLIKKRPKPLNYDDKRALSELLKNVEDPAIQEKLQTLGKAILQDRAS